MAICKLWPVLGPLVTLILVMLALQAAILLVVRVPWNDLIGPAAGSGVGAILWKTTPAPGHGHDNGSACASGAPGNLTRDREPGLRTMLQCAASETASTAGGVPGGINPQLCARSFQPGGVALHPFVLFSAYRESVSSVDLIGLISRIIYDYGKPEFQCSWHPARLGKGRSGAAGLQSQSQPEGSVITTAAILHDGGSGFSNLPYAEVVLKCDFKQAVGADGGGGFLYLKVEFAGSKESGRNRSRRHEMIGQVPPMLVMQEEEGYNFTAAVKTEAPYPLNYAFCGPPISGNVRGEVIREWLIYHLYMYTYQGTKAHFFFYDVGGLGQEDRQLLQPFVEAGFLTIWDVIDSFRYPAWYHSQILLMNDCMYRLQHLTDWVVFHDFDEFLYVAPPNTFSSLVQANAEAPTMTFGSWPIDIRSCRQQDNNTEWPLERMRWRRPLPECRNNLNGKDPFLCPGPPGRRKLVVNPRKAIVVSVHETQGPSYKQAVHFNASLIRLEHYQGLLSATKAQCSIPRNRSISMGFAAVQSHNEEWIEMEPSIIPVLGRAKTYVMSLLNVGQ